MLEPVGVVAGRIVAARLSAAAFPARLGGNDRSLCRFNQIVELERFHPGGIERLALVIDGDALDALLELHDLGHAFAEQLLIAKNAAMRLHRSSQCVRDIGDPLAAGRCIEAGEASHRGIGCVARKADSPRYIAKQIPFEQ